MFFSTLFITSILSASPVLAEEIILEPVTVQGSRLSNERRSVQVITETEIQKSNIVYIGDLLRRSSGVDWTGNGFAYIRGGTGAQTLVYIDGVRVNDPTDPNRAYDFSSIDLSQVARIEIFKGPQSVSFGSDAMAGVISITTKRAEGLQRNLNLLAGNENTYRGTALISTPIGKTATITLRASHQRSDGPSIAKTTDGDLDKKRLGVVGAMIRLTPSPQTEFTFGGEANYLKQDLDGGSFRDDPNLISRTLQKTAYLKLKSNWTESSQTQILISRRNNRRSYEDKTDPYNTLTPQDSTYYGTLTDLDLSHRIFIHSGHEIVLGSELKNEKIEIESQLSPTPLLRNHLMTWGAYVQDRLDLGQGFTSEIGLRHERPSHFTSSTQKKLGLEKHFADTTRVHAAFGTGFKVPALYSLYDSNYGNPNLQIEKSRAFELGVEQTLSDQNLIRLTGFTTRYKDLISYNSTTNRSENISEAQIEGLELDTQWLKAQSLSFQTHTTYLHAWDRLNKSPLPRRARWKGGLILDHQTSDKTHFQGEWIIKSSLRDSAAQTVRTPMYSLFNFTSDYQLSKTFKTTLRIENLFDRNYFETLGYSTLGRSFYAGIEAKF
jgi:vitamin B12 transporter